MRKVSKSRAEEDVVSSTSGSINHEADDRDANTALSENDNTKEDSQVDAENGDDNDEDSLEGKPKKKGGKSKGKKKTPAKTKNSINKQEEYEVDKIIDSKKIKGKLHYLIRWKGYSASSDTWEPENTVSCPDLINKFNENEGKPKKESKTKQIGRKRKSGKSDTKSPAKRPKTTWDSENADENEEYEVERILEVHFKKNGKRDFLIHWKGWSNKFDSWEPEEHLNCSDLIKKFMAKVDNARTKDAKNLRIAPETTNRFTLQQHMSGRRLSKRCGQRQRVRYDDAE